MNSNLVIMNEKFKKENSEIVIWMCEFILILGGMLGIIRSQVIRPFIEHENEWAIHDTAHSILLAAGEYDDEELNDNIRRNIHCLLDLPVLQQVESTCYYAIEVYRSEDLRENREAAKPIVRALLIVCSSGKITRWTGGAIKKLGSAG